MYKEVVRQSVKRLLFLVGLIAPALTTTAQNAVVEESTDIVCDKLTHAVMHFKKSVTILNGNAASLGYYICSCNPSSQLTSFKGIVTDAAGNIIRKMKMKDLQRSEYSPYLAIDDYLMYIEYTPPSYPITITYEWEMDCQNNLIEFPSFRPQTDYEIAVKKAVYHLTAPPEVGIRYALQNISQSVIRSKDAKGADVYTLELTNLPALKKEPLSRPFHERVPIAYFAPSLFVYYGTQGGLRNWSDFGMWQYGMLRGSHVLPDAIKQEIHQLTDSLQDDHKKVEALYKLLGKTTRYVAVLLGIGGQRPASASSVYNSGYGDCKGLTNYMRAMLEEIGIESHYSTISTVNRHLIKDFASVGQMDHVILQVPLPNDTIWLECTNPQLPFGYIHQDIAGHDAIEISRAGGRLVKVPVYTDSTNLKRSTFQLTIDDDNSVNMDVSIVFTNQWMEGCIPLLKMDNKELQKSILQMIYAPHSEFINAATEIDGNRILLKTKLKSKSYITATGKRLFIPVCPSLLSAMPSLTGDRQEDIYIERGYRDLKDVIIEIPEGYMIESMPKGLNIEGPFGSCTMILIANETRINIIYQLQIKSGTYDKALFSQFNEFMKTASTGSRQNIVLKKKP